MLSPNSSAPRPLRHVAVLSALGFLGVLAIIPNLLPLLQTLPADAPPPPVMLALTLIQSMVLIGVAATVGTWLTPRVGFAAPVITGQRPLSALGGLAPFSLLAGGIAGILVVAGDVFLFRNHIPAQLYMLAQKPAWSEVAPALLYGGIVEEILMRWGLMTLITWLLYRLISGGKGPVSPVFVWIGISSAAVLFGLLHLPYVELLGGGDATMMVVRTLVLNGIVGLLVGWLFARRGLESAMLAHMGTHLGMFLMRILFGG